MIDLENVIGSKKAWPTSDKFFLFFYRQQQKQPNKGRGNKYDTRAPAARAEESGQKRGWLAQFSRVPSVLNM